MGDIRAMPNIAGLVTFGPRQSATSFRSSVDDFRRHGVTLDLRYFEQFFWRHPLKAVSSDREIIERIGREHYDFVILNSGASLMYRPRLLRRLLNTATEHHIPIFVLWRNARMKFDEIQLRIGVDRYLDAKRMLSRRDITHLGISEQTCTDIADELGVVRPTCVYNCQRVGAEYLTPTRPADPPLVLNVGSVIPRKDPETFVRIAKLVCEKHATVRFCWLGGQATATIRRQIEAANLQRRVEFFDFVPDPFRFMQQSSLFLLTSVQEAFGLVLAEAMACARTVFCFSGTGAAEVAGPTGEVLEAGNTQLAVERILAFLNRDPEDRVNVAARDRYLQLYSPAAYAMRFSDVIRVKLGRTG